MEILNTLPIIHNLKFIMLLVYIIVALIISLFNWLYLANMIHVTRGIDLEPPERINHLVNASIFTAMGTVILSGGFLLTGYY